jgi:hypothetical protein
MCLKAISQGYGQEVMGRVAFIDSLGYFVEYQSQSKTTMSTAPSIVVRMHYEMLARDTCLSAFWSRRRHHSQFATTTSIR